MAAKVVTVGEGDKAYTVLMDVPATDETEDFVAKLPRAQAEAKTKAQLVDYVSLDEDVEDEEDNA